MQLEFRRFQREYYPTYAAWFVDVELNRRLGPMDQEWLDAVLAEQEADGITWAVFRADELVAVIETGFDPQGQWPTAIMGLAVKPSLRHQGIGKAVLQKTLAMHHAQGKDKHVTYVAQDNEVARRFVVSLGFAPTMNEPDEHGFVEYQYG